MDFYNPYDRPDTGHLHFTSSYSKLCNELVGDFHQSTPQILTHEDINLKCLTDVRKHWLERAALVTGNNIRFVCLER